MKRKKLAIIFTLIFIVIVLFLLYFLNRNDKQDSPHYSSYKIEKPADLNFAGKAVPIKQQMITYDANLGTISTINVIEGQTVKAGDVLITYSNQNNHSTLAEKEAMQQRYETDIANLEQDLATANTKLQKAKNNNDEQGEQTYEEKTASINSSIENYQDQLTEISAQIETLENMKETIITAEFDGIAHVNEKMKGNTSEPVVTLYSNETIIETTVTEYDVEKVNTEQELVISYVNQLKEIDGKIIFKNSTPESNDQKTAQYLLRISSNETIPLGYSVKISISQSDLHIPTNCIKEEMGQQYVFVYKNGKAKKTIVEVEKISNEQYKVVEGLSVGDLIIKNPKGITDKMDVKI